LSTIDPNDEGGKEKQARLLEQNNKRVSNVLNKNNNNKCNNLGPQE
jgi:hypothetical protein